MWTGHGLVYAPDRSTGRVADHVWASRLRAKANGSNVHECPTSCRPTGRRTPQCCLRIIGPLATGEDVFEFR